MDNVASRSTDASHRTAVPRPRAVRALAAASVALLLFVWNCSVSARTIVASEDIPFGPGSAAMFVDLFGDGSQDLLLAGPEGVALFEGRGRGAGGGANQGFKDGDERWQELFRLPPLPAPVTAVAAADVTGDGVKELVLGTGQAGAVYVLGRTGTGWTVLGQTPYMWSPVRSVLAADFTGDGRAEIIALSEEGRVAAFGWRGVAPEPLPRPPLGAATHLVLMGPDGEGKNRLVAAEAGGRVAIWSWPWHEPDWQTFVWGLPASVSVFQGPAGSDDRIVVTTYERLLYNFSGQDHQFVSAGVPLNDVRLPFSFAVPALFPGVRDPVLLAANADGFGLWRVAGTSLSALAEGWAEGPLWALPLPEGDGFVIGEGERGPSLWEMRPGDYFRFVVDGRPLPLADPPLYRQSQVLLSSRDWAAALGLQLHWEPVRQTITLWRGLDFAVLTMNEWDVVLPRGSRTVSAAPVNEGGRTYMPPELPTWFGFEYRWDPRTRSLEVRTRGQGIFPFAPNLSL